MITFFEIIDREKRSLFFKNIFLLSNFNIDNVLKILFLIFSNVKVNFLELEFF